MTREQLDGLYLTMLGIFIFIFLGLAFEIANPTSLSDFKALYYPARTLVQQRDPYAVTEVMRAYLAEGKSNLADTAKEHQIATQNLYPPTALLLIAPVALLMWGPAHVLWLIICIGCFIVAVFLISNLGATYEPAFAGLLVFLVLANSELLVLTGNIAGVSISLGAVAVWCFLQERFVVAGVLCLAISLAVKPHETCLVWLYFLLAGGVYRKRALQSLLVVLAIGLPAVLWVWHLSPNWLQEMHTNLIAFSQHGAMNDPGPASSGGHGPDMLINLQTVFSLLRDDPRFYNPASYLVCALLLLFWAGITLWAKPSRRRVWLALASVAALSMLPVYHRQLDAKLLLLTVPACAMLWAEGGLTGKLALLVNSTAFVFTGDLSWSIILGVIGKLNLPATHLVSQIFVAAQALPAPLALLFMCIFYLWVYARSARDLADDKSALGRVAQA